MKNPFPERRIPTIFDHEFITKGGPGSGNRGHAGRPGMRGGSSAGGGKAPESPSKAPEAPPAPKPVPAPKNAATALLERYTKRYGTPDTWSGDTKLGFLAERVGSLQQRELKKITMVNGDVVSIQLSRAGAYYGWAVEGKDGTLRGSGMGTFHEALKGALQAHDPHAFDPHANPPKETVSSNNFTGAYTNDGRAKPLGYPSLGGRELLATPKNVPAKYTPMKTLAEAEQYTRDVLGITDDGLPRNIAIRNHFNEAMTEIHNAGFHIPAEVVNQSRSADRMIAAMGCSFNGSGRVLAVHMITNGRSPAWGRDFSQMTEAEHFTAARSHVDYFIHEAGHLNHMLVNPQGYVQINHYHGSVAIRHKALAEQIKREVSAYASTRPVEFVAEAFLMKFRGKKLSPELEQYYKDLGGP